MGDIELYKDYGQPTIEAFGLHWMVRTDAWHPGGPAANQKWNPSAVTKQGDGSLHISTAVQAGEPLSAEIVSAESLGYGTFEASYEIVTPTRMRDLHKNVVWGIFPFDWEDTKPGYQEIDIVEDSYWSGYTDMVGKYTYYPGDENSGIHLNDRVWTASGQGATCPHDMAPWHRQVGDMGECLHRGARQAPSLSTREATTPGTLHGRCPHPQIPESPHQPVGLPR